MNQYILLNILIPVIVKLFIPDGRYGALTMITDIIVLPGSLLIMNICFTCFKLSRSFTVSCFMMLLGLLLGNLVGYVIWGLSSGRLLKPDGETLEVIKELAIYYIIFAISCVVGGLIFNWIASFLRTRS